MKIKGVLWPDEWLSAIEAGQDLLSASRETAHSYVKTLIAILLPILIGGAGFYLVELYVFNVAGLITDDVVRALMTVVAILAGFMITTILFTGRPNGLSALNSHELREVRGKISYLVFSQCLTLASHVVTAIVCIMVMAVYEDTPRWAGAAIAGLLTNSLIRSAVLPLQIWEVHAFSLDVEISERIKQERAMISDDGA